MVITEYNRTEARRGAEETAKRADMKQHADKIFQGLEKLDENQAKRAIWELFQNAIDLSEKCEIIITLTNEAIEFKHNGEPFTSETLICLIKQVSSKNPEKDDGQVGQYGTGFITTHSFGKKILLSGSLKEENFYIPLKNFEIDRIVKKSDELVDRLAKQQNEVFDLIEKGEQKKEKELFTIFKYITMTESEKQYAKEAIFNLKLILPYVMAITANLHKVTIIDNFQKEMVYEKQGCSSKVKDFNNDLTVSTICINAKTQKIYSISSQDQDMIIILPLDEQYRAFSLDDKLSKLFLFYPLIGTEDFGFNFLVHSKLFAPTEPRDGIYLKSNNEQRKEKEKHNSDLLQKIFEDITNFISKHCDKIQNVHFLAKISFNTQNSNNPLLSEYFKEIKQQWVDKFKTFPLVETTKLKLNPKDVLFFSEELLEKEDYFDSIYAIVSLFWENIPKKEIAKVWTEYAGQWESDIKYITIMQIVEKIKETKTLDFYKENINNLKRFYKYLIETHRSEFFDEYEILPNIKNEFRKKTELNIYPEINEELIKIADVIIPDILKHYIKNGFEFISQFKPYGIEEFVKDINTELLNIVNDDKSTSNILDALVKYCSIFPNVSEENSMRSKLLKLILKYYNKVNIKSITIYRFPEKWWLTPTKCLFRLFTKELNAKGVDWIKENEQFLLDLLSIVYDYYEFEDTLESLSLFPNQGFKLCKQNELEIDKDIPDNLKDLYDKIVQDKKPIRDILLLKSFSNFLKHKKYRNPEDLGSEIERKFELQEYNDEKINQHEHIQGIIDIIKLISSDKKWEQFFPTINNKKASIMLARISENKTKEDLFSIISLKSDKIKILGELAKEDNLEDIIEKGKAAVEIEKQNRANWQHKRYIGLYIQEEVRKGIKGNLEKFKIDGEFEAMEKQGGQDIIIAKYNEKPVYYIEIKSRWTQKSSIEMSKLQMKTAIENKDIYSLCCVDMSKYREKYKKDGYNVNIEEIEEFIKILFYVGNKIDSNLQEIIDTEKDKESGISLSEGYRGTVHQKLLENEGKTLKDLISKLVDVCCNFEASRPAIGAN